MARVAKAKVALAKFIKATRELRGLQQSDCARSLGIKPQNYYRYELDGTFPKKYFATLARLMGSTEARIKELASGDNEVIHNEDILPLIQAVSRSGVKKNQGWQFAQLWTMTNLGATLTPTDVSRLLVTTLNIRRSK